MEVSFEVKFSKGKIIKLLTLILLSLNMQYMLGCASNCPSLQNPASVVPTWVEHLPLIDGGKYAVGIVGRTLYYEDGIRQAADEARKELDKAIESN